MSTVHRVLLLATLTGIPGLAHAQSNVVSQSNLDLGNRYLPTAPEPEGYVQRKVRLPFTRVAETLWLHKVGGRYFFQDDIIVDGDGLPVVAAGVEDQDDRWPDGVLPIAISADVMANPDVLERLYDALNMIMLHSELQFVPRGTHKDYIEVVFGPGVPGAAASSMVGRRGGRQELVIHALDARMGTLAHELLHAAGLYHEHSRPDRDAFVGFDLSGMSEAQRSNFRKVDAKMGGPYDYLSIMHYPPFVAMRPGAQTVFCHTDGQQVDCPGNMGQRVQLSSGDVAGLDAIYSEISRFSDRGWDATISRAVPVVARVPFSGSFEWTRAVGSPKQPVAVDGSVDYLGLQVLAPRHKTITWSEGRKSVSYDDWRDAMTVRFRPVALSAVGGALGFDADVPGTVPLIVKAEAFAPRWNPPPKPLSCVLRTATCGPYWLGFDSAATGSVAKPYVRAPYRLQLTGGWNARAMSTPFERGAKTITLSPLQEVVEKPLWSMKPLEGVYRIEPASP